MSCSGSPWARTPPDTAIMGLSDYRRGSVEATGYRTRLGECVEGPMGLAPEVRGFVFGSLWGGFVHTQSELAHTYSLWEHLC
jgi:hypothetical protein